MYLLQSNTISKKEFKPTTLYIKQHNKTGLKYFGQTRSKDPVKYRGSGSYWKDHLKIHGKDVSTIWYQTFYDRQELIDYATTFSIKHDIVKAKDENGNKIWANLKEENGLDGGGNCDNLRKTNSKLQKILQRQKVLDGTHHFLDGTVASNTQTQRVKDGTHSFLGGKIQRESQQKIVAAGEHPFQDSEWHRKAVQQQLKNGNHASQTKKTCEHCNTTCSSNNYSKHHGNNCKLVNPKPTITCEHCGTSVTNKTNYVRYHGNKCKLKIR